MLLISRFFARQWIDSLQARRVTGHSGEPLQIGEKLRVQVIVQNAGRFPFAWLLVEDTLPIAALAQSSPALRPIGARIALTQLRRGHSAVLDYEIEFLRRGYYQIGPVLTETGDLFGLHRRYRVLTEPQFVMVLPKIVSLQGYDLTTRRPVGEIRMTHRLFEDPTRIAGVRAYQHGDPFNRIHWHATARTAALQSKVYEPSSIAGATLVLDFHSTAELEGGPVYRTELAVTTAASLANALHELGQRIGLITNGRDAADRIREEGWAHEFRTRSKARADIQMRERSDRLRPTVVETRRGVDQYMRILETLARLELSDGLAFHELLGEAGNRLPRNTTVIAILTQVPPESAIALINLQRRGYVVAVVWVGDATTPEWAERPEWASWLLGSGIELHSVDNEAALSDLCSEHLLR